MRTVVVAVMLVAAGCAPAGAASAPVSTAATPAPAESATRAANGSQLYVLEGTFLSPIQNGARVAIANGWIEPRFAPYPPGPRAELDVVVVSAATGAPSPAEVIVLYEMVEMAHGTMALRATPGAATGHHVARLEFVMRGTWLLRVRVLLDGVTSSATLVLAEDL